MFYVNNEEIKGLYIGDIPYNYIVSGFSKIIPEDRNAEVVNLNLAGKQLHSYRVEYGSLEDGYTNAPIQRIDEPDYNSVYHTPFTFFDGNNIVPTKNVPIVIRDGRDAFYYGNVYNDININGNYSKLAEYIDFQGKTIRTNSELGEYDQYLRNTVFENCNNFTAELKSKVAKSGEPALYYCNNFNGNYKFEGAGVQYPGFRGFLEECRDAKFNIDTTNMRGGGSDANVQNYYNFSCIRYCDNIDLNITGSNWQAWPQMQAFSSSCNINTFNIIPGFGGLYNSNINATLPKDSTPEIESTYEFLKDSNSCSYKLIANDCNLYNFYSGVGGSYMFENLNNCNLNLLLNNSVVMDRTFGNHINNSNIKFDDIGVYLATYLGWGDLQNCNIQGSIVKSDYNDRGFIEYSNNLNLNLNVYNTNKIDVLRFVNDSKGSIVVGKESHIKHSNNLNINTNLGNLQLYNVSNSNFRLNNTETVLYSGNKVYINGANIRQISDCNNVNVDFYFNGSFPVSKWCQRSNNINIYTYGNITDANMFIDNCSNVTLRHPNNNHLLNTGVLENLHNCNIYGNVYVNHYWRDDHINANGLSGVSSEVQYTHCNNMNMRVSKGNAVLYNVRDSYIQCSLFSGYNSFINSDCSNLTINTIQSRNYGKQISGNCFFGPGFVFFDNAMNVTFNVNPQLWNSTPRVSNGSNYNFNSTYPWTKINDVTCNMNNYGTHYFRPDGPVGSVTFNCHMYGPPSFIVSSRWDSDVITTKGSGGIQFQNSMFSTDTFEVYSPSAPYISNCVSFMSELIIENNTQYFQVYNSVVGIMDSMHHSSSGPNTLNLSVKNSLLFLGFSPNNTHRVTGVNSTIIVPNSFNKQSIENQVVFGGSSNTNVYTMSEWVLQSVTNSYYPNFVTNVMAKVGWNVNSPFPIQSRYISWTLNPGHDDAMLFLRRLRLV